ncbi:NADPH:quinone oxidoreductase family protein [Actinomadura madurae]|uniref:NADPH:quinone oxidoreductase family protein n=1 Tax=Actinomadura madurae TaxID=1993 RepID=UPI00399A93F8
MRAQELRRLAGPDGLELVEIPDPPENGRDVVIDVRAAGVSFPELLYTYGKYQDRREPPFVPGVEVAGVVHWAPPEVPVTVGDRVAACTFFGGFAERATASPDFTFRLADELSFEQGAALVLNYQTAHFCLSHRGRVASGETVLVHGAAGGVGTAALQVLAGLDAQPIAVVSSVTKRDFVLAHMPDVPVVLLRTGWTDEVRDLTDGRGVDAVFDPVGGDRFTVSLRVLAQEGRVIVVGFADGQIPSVKVNRLLLRNVGVVGAAWGPFVQADPRVARGIGDALADMGRRGLVAPVVGSRFQLAEAADALREVERRTSLGKVVLQVPPR